ncbi:MAG TPA: hypothetical protein VGK19_21375 [Capsulimonadaceae bacterium]|jgi:Tfp pilus assembly protein PilX
MLHVPDVVKLAYVSKLTVVAAAREAGIGVRLAKSYYRALAFREAAALEREAEQAVRDRVHCLTETGVRQAIEDSDPAGACSDYPLDALRTWGLGGVPSCFGVGYDG